jgi:hypothetical protein
MTTTMPSSPPNAQDVVTAFNSSETEVCMTQRL